jgi:hypothetical protein
LKQNGKTLMLHSDNTIYLPYEIKAGDSRKFGSMPAVLLLMNLPDDLSAREFKRICFRELRREIREVGIKLINTKRIYVLV